MLEREFNDHADAMLARIEQALENCAADVDYEIKPGGVIELEFSHAGGSRIIINRHTAAREIWVAAKSGGFHYRWNGSAWIDTRSGEELFAAVSRLASSQAGEPIELAA